MESPGGRRMQFKPLSRYIGPQAVARNCGLPRGDPCNQQTKPLTLALLLQPVRARTLRLLVRFLQIPARLIQRSLGVVVGLDSLPVFVGGPLPLAGDIENLAQLNVTPDFGPARLPVAIERIAVGVGRSLIVVLQEKYFRYAIVRQGAVLVDIEGLVEFRKRTRHVSLLHQRGPSLK